MIYFDSSYLLAATLKEFMELFNIYIILLPLLYSSLLILIIMGLISLKELFFINSLYPFKFKKILIIN